jgi:hypothetical protein
MAQSEQAQEDQQSGYIFCTSSAGALDSNVIGKVQVQWILVPLSIMLKRVFLFVTRDI